MDQAAVEAARIVADKENAERATAKKHKSERNDYSLATIEAPPPIAPKGTYVD